jgi:hypothetical protein
MSSFTGRTRPTAYRLQDLDQRPSLTGNTDALQTQITNLCAPLNINAWTVAPDTQDTFTDANGNVWTPNTFTTFNLQNITEGVLVENCVGLTLTEIERL